ncbi:Z1 domain-containing protein [Deinococcus sp. SM5_A1]|uniref:Z1 domain-containing protein n=1 Tax=Deinococcus sp. SM5_A1 TaxID=3379094 RepID=UPI00385B78FC
MAEDNRQTRIEYAAEITGNMLTAFRQTAGRPAGPVFVRQQAIQTLDTLGYESELLDEVVCEIERHQDVALEGVSIVSPDVGQAEDTAVWQLPPTSPLLQRYLQQLEREGWSAGARTNLKQVTRRILGLCGNPRVAGTWNRRGMVVGDVQSGKTTSYVSLICAAIDAGYRNIVVLGGRTNDLRHQTQERIDLGVTGIESSGLNVAKTRIGVGLIGQIPGLTMLSLTSQDHVAGNGKGKKGGDFDKRRANHNNLAGSAVRIAVIKKHATMIGHVADWLQSNGELAAEPLLLIDDEADDASIDTNDPDQSPTSINGAIRLLLQRAGRSTYVAYTATPYANVMIDPEARGEKHGDDLFPRDFIALLKPSPNYFGARRFLEEEDGLSHTVKVEDAENWISKGSVVSDMPASLSQAIREFVLVSAVRRVRRARLGLDRQHESMLIHSSVRTGAHGKIHTQVQREVDRLQAGWDFPVAEPGKVPQVETEFGETWDSLKDRQDPGQTVTWNELRPHITDVFERLTTETINGVTKKGLDYRRARSGPLTVIAIGGTKLSRGLTLEGLTTSYHLRASLQHDTLMQMCRWFGYRLGYEDLCRLHAPGDLLHAFSGIMESDEELRAELEDMASMGATPLDFGLRIRTSPGMTVTGRNKLKHAITVPLSLAGRTLEVTRTALTDAAFNDDLMQGLVSELVNGQGQQRPGSEHVWDDVPWETLQGPLEAFRELSSTLGLNGKLARSMAYVRSAQDASPPRLRRWTVVLAGRQGTPEPYGDINVVRVTRSARDEDGVLNFGAISNPSDERLARGTSEGKTRQAVKSTRPRDEGLLIIYPIITIKTDVRTSGFALSFPGDPEMRRHNYTLNPVAQAEEMRA